MHQNNYQNKHSIFTIILGAHQSGKSSLINSLKDTYNQTNSLTQYWSSKELGRSQIDLQFQEFSTAEIDERFILEISQQDYPLIIVLLFDISDPNSFQEIVTNYYVNQMLNEVRISDCGFILLGTKSDLQNQVQDNDITQFLNQKYYVSYQNASAITNKGISELKKSLFNLAKQQLLQTNSHASTRSKWQSMDENGENSQWGSETSQSSSSFDKKRYVKSHPRHTSQIEEVMTILDEYKNNFFESKIDSIYQEEEEQSINSQFEEYTDAINSHCENVQQNETSSHHISQTTIHQQSKQVDDIEIQQYDDHHDFEQSNCEIRNINPQVQTSKQNINSQKIQNPIKQQSQVGDYFLSIGKKSLINNKFISQNSNVSSSSSYSQIYDKKKNSGLIDQQKQQIQISGSENSCYNSSEKWEIGVLEQMKGINDSKSIYSDQISGNSELVNNLFMKKNRSPSIVSEQEISQQLQVIKKQESSRVYANPFKNNTSNYENNQDTFICSVEENSHTFNIINEQEDSQLKVNQDSNCSSNRYHQIHSFKQKNSHQSSYQESQNYEYSEPQPLKQRSQNTLNQDLNKSSTFLVKINLEQNKPNDKIVFKQVQQQPKKLNRSISPLNKSDIKPSQNRIIFNDKENIKNKDKCQVNSFLKKKDIRYLMNLCLHYQGQEIYIDVMKDESSFDIAHKFCKKVNIHPTILQIKNISKIIQQQIDDYISKLNQQLENVEKNVLQNNNDKFEDQMSSFLKENKNFLVDANNIDFSFNRFKFQQQEPTPQKNKNMSRRNSIKTTTPTKTKLYVRSKSPIPTFKSSNKI